MKDTDNPLDQIKVAAALKSEHMKMVYRIQFRPKDVSELDYTIIAALARQIPQKAIEKHYEETGEKPYIKLVCPGGCNYQVSKYDSYCCKCGQALEW